ncbi:MAG: hypothetical protein ACYDB7_14920 [Mycobacteriales bacterium]
MTRLFWVAFGATAGVVVAYRLRKVALAYAPKAWAANLGGSVRGFAEEVRSGMAEREAELRAGLGLDGGLDDARDVDPAGKR